MAFTTIYIVRHAHSDWTGGDRDDDRPLSPAGADGANAVASRLAALPITAVYSSPYRRSVETVAPLAERLGVRPVLVHALRERELPAVPPEDFDRLVADAWCTPSESVRGGESNVMAQARALTAIRTVLEQHQGEHVVVGTHGNLFALIVNGLDPTRGYEFWKQISFPDVYRLEFDGFALVGLARIWDTAA